MSPEMKVGTVEMVSVQWIMQNATHSVDGFEDWDNNGFGVDYAEMVNFKGHDGYIGAIAGNIMTYGFRIPIVMVLDYEGEGTLVHGDGHHRFVTAILLGLDEIPVFWSDGDYMAYNSTGSTSKLEHVDDYWESLDGLIAEVGFF